MTYLSSLEGTFFNISSGTNCVLLVDLFLYSYETEIIQKRIKDKNK